MSWVLWKSEIDPLREGSVRDGESDVLVVVGGEIDADIVVKGFDVVEVEGGVSVHSGHGDQ